jgi:CubicO group peptidase (beta-lactamase class C family)
MDSKKFLIGSLVAGSAVALYRLLSAQTSSAKPVSSSSAYAALDAYIDEQMHRLRIPGASLAVLEGNRVVHQRGFGLARPGGELPTAQTPFFIGSLTKSFTALGVMQLVEAGKVDLDAPVQRYLPWFRVADLQASEQITLRHLLNQTSGFPAMAGEVILEDYGDGPDATERKVRSMATLKTNPVGEKCDYCNLNYDVLGLIIETVSGEAYPDYIQNHIFNPLEMSHSYTKRAVAKQNGLARGHRHWFGFPVPAPDLPDPRAALPSGYLISCVEDMAHYLSAHMNGGRYKDVQILSAPGIDELHRGVMEYFPMGIPSGKYGMGWFDIDLGDTKTFTHSGNVPDFSAYMGFIPDQHKGLVILFNADPYGLPPITEEIGMGMVAVLAGKQPEPMKWGFLQWIFRLLPLLPLLQVVGILITLRSARRVSQEPSQRLRGWPLWGRHILLPLIPNLSFSALLVYLKTTGTLNFLQLFMPDLASIAGISGWLGGIWSVQRTWLVLRTLGKHQS